MRPYDATDDPELWRTAYRWAERAASVGLGVTVHVGEFATTSVAAALCTPGLRRVGHGTHVADDPHLLDDLARSGVTLECSLTCNVVLGSAPAYEAHPLRQFVQHGIPVTLATDLPMHVCTTIGASTRSLRGWASRPTTCAYLLGTRSPPRSPRPRVRQRCFASSTPDLPASKTPTPCVESRSIPAKRPGAMLELSKNQSLARRC